MVRGARRAVSPPMPCIFSWPARVSYICGRGYGTASIAIHVPQCVKMFEAEQLKKDKKDRRPLPVAPPGWMEAVSGGSSPPPPLQQQQRAAFGRLPRRRRRGLMPPLSRRR